MSLYEVLKEMEQEDIDERFILKQIQDIIQNRNMIRLNKILPLMNEKYYEFLIERCSWDNLLIDTLIKHNIINSSTQIRNIPIMEYFITVINCYNEDVIKTLFENGCTMQTIDVNKVSRRMRPTVIEYKNAELEQNKSKRPFILVGDKKFFLEEEIKN
jgi:hypothetical protein